MAAVQQHLPLLLSCLLSGVFMSSVSSSYHNRVYTPPVVPPLTDSFPRVPVDQGFNKAYGAPNIKLLNNGSMATIALDNTTGCGLVSKNAYHHGFFSASIKLPAGLASGVVVAFYLSNAERFPHNHDEIDIELLGRDRKDDWVFQTNVYANGSVSTGREEKFYFWFDPTQDYHYYSILWNPHHIVFMVDNIPVREFPNNGVVYPSKPMSVYMTIWDGSDWATHGGKYPVNYKNAPFVASVTGTEMAGCVADNPAASNSTCSKRSSTVSGVDPVDGQDFVKLSDEQAVGLDWARRKLMFYSYCKDTPRYKPVMPPECK